MTEGYDDIISLPHHISTSHPHMPVSDRAAQFAPFAALTGYGDAVKETERLTDRQIELDEYEKATLSLAAAQIKERPEITITYFRPDDKKLGGAYLTVTGCLKKIDSCKRMVYMTDGTKVAIDKIIEIN